MRSLKTHVHMTKKFPNSLIFRFNHKLISIMVSKGRIYGELEKILDILKI